MGGLLVLISVAGMLWLHHTATDFPREDPVRVVDAELVQRLRAEPGLHVAFLPLPLLLCVGSVLLLKRSAKRHDD